MQNDTKVVKGLFLNFSEKANMGTCFSVLTHAFHVFENNKELKTNASVFSPKFILDDFDEPFLHLNTASLFSMTTSLNKSAHYLLEMGNFNNKALTLLGVGVGRSIDLSEIGLDIQPMRVAAVSSELFNQILQRKVSGIFTLKPTVK